MVWPAAFGLWLAAGAAAAAGLGPGDPGATLGQPLNFAVAVRLDAGEVLSPECVSADVVIGDRRVPPPLVRTAIEMTSATAARVRVLTQSNVDEPIVQIQLAVGCGSRLSRSYVVLADPPGMALSSPPPAPAALAQAGSPPPAAVAPAPAATEPAPVPPPRIAAAPTPAPAPALTPEQLRAREERRARLREQRLARQQAAREAREARQRAEVERAAAAPRLRLDITEPAPSRPGNALEADAVAQAMAAVAEAASAAQSAAAAASASALRVATLEQELARLRTESQASRDLATALREQLGEARSSSRWTTPLVLASLLLAALAAWLAWRLGRVQAAQRDQWQQVGGGRTTSASAMGDLDAAASMRTPTAPAPFVSREVEPQGVRSPSGAEPAGASAAAPTVELPRPAAAAARAKRAWPPPAPPVAWPQPPTLPPELPAETLPGLYPEPDKRSEPKPGSLRNVDRQPEPPMQRTEALPAGGRSNETSPRDVSIEELIDLEQQAEFFMVLGQDEAAVDLLVEHLRSTGGGSPLPYLKLLEIHHRRGDHEAYERMRHRFNDRFNAYAPEWGVDLTSGRSLEDYAGVVPRLQQVWSRPLDAMAELEALLFRKSRGALFDLPAYREVLFLYSLARDLLDRTSVDSGSVDLLLPMSDGIEDGITAPAPLDGLDRDAFKETRPFGDSAPMPSLDFDLTGSDRPTSIFDLLDDKPRPRS